MVLSWSRMEESKGAESVVKAPTEVHALPGRRIF